MGKKNKGKARQQQNKSVSPCRHEVELGPGVDKLSDQSRGSWGSIRQPQDDLLDDDDQDELIILKQNNEQSCPCISKVQQLKVQLRKERTDNATLKMNQDISLEELKAQNDALMAERDALKMRIFNIEAKAMSE